MSASEKPIYRFGEFDLDPDERRLLARGAPVTLTPKVFETLVLLVERAGHAVSKDELMRVLWPRGFVDESNITKHIWMIRKVLGEGAHDAFWIETIPKLGYRFKAPVQCIERSESFASPRPFVTATVPSGAMGTEPVASARERVPTATSADTSIAEADHFRDASRASLMLRSPNRRLVAGVAFLAIAAAGALLVSRLVQRVPDAPESVAAGTSVAIVQFNNLSQNAKDAWLGPALGEMLATEMAAGGGPRALPDELVRPAQVELPAPMAGGYAAQSLGTLRRRLGADYVLSGITSFRALPVNRRCGSISRCRMRTRTSSWRTSRVTQRCPTCPR